MVMDFVQGGDFFTLMRKHRRLPEEWVRIYIGEIALALQHLHDMDVVYRDLKPENILLCSDGHLKLTDFGLSRFFETRPPAPEDMIGEDDIITRSFCGTEQYMSPEMLLQQGHNFRMDWWCVGLIMHEMISAKHPFHGPSHYDTLRNMVTKQPVIDNRLTVHAATVVRSMLIKNPRARLCCRSGVEELKSLPFFASLDWTALYEKRISMAYLPELKGVEDVSSFESTFTREEAVDSVTSEGATSAKKKKGGGILGLFGLGGGADKDEKDPEDMDSFRDFGFVKTDEDAPGTDSTVTSPTAAAAAAAGGNDAAADTSSGGGGNGTESTVPQTIFVPAEPIRKNKAAQ
jgi:serine/threonine protein kinase